MPRSSAQPGPYRSYGLKLGWGRTWRGMYRVLGGPIKEYTRTLVQGSHVNKS